MGNTSIKTTFRTGYFLTIAAGFWIGKIKVGQFSLGIVTSVLLVWSTGRSTQHHH